MRLSIALVASIVSGVFSLSNITTPSPITAAPEPCYTYTTSIYPSKACPTVEGCIDLMCITYSTSTMPCPTASCPVTPTATVWEACTTTCRDGCATSVTNVVESMCPKVTG
ncbi:hypothetical protein M432DRAFT_209784 [Thermoascus aurantiacus ATCC 26904]